MASLIAKAITMAAGYAYPAYECFKCVEKARLDMDHLRFWCRYWIIIAILTVLERALEMYISWLPMYAEAKLAFIVYLWYPKTKGTTYVYTTFLQPILASNEPDIDRNLNELKTRSGDLLFFHGQKAFGYVQNRLSEILQYIAAQPLPSSQANAREDPLQQGSGEEAVGNNNLASEYE